MVTGLRLWLIVSCCSLSRYFYGWVQNRIVSDEARAQAGASLTLSTFFLFFSYLFPVRLGSLRRHTTSVTRHAGWTPRQEKKRALGGETMQRCVPTAYMV